MDLSFVETILKHTKSSESPRRYYYWSALAAIAAVVRNNVYLDKFHYKLYANIYVLLVGKSGLRKGPPVNLAKALVAAVDNTKLITGRSSIQAIIAELSKAVTKPGGGPPLVDAAGFLVSSEFASFIIGDPQALTILTDLYDGHYNPEWVNMTKVSGQERLKNPCVTMLGASNEVHIKDAIPDNAMGGGFFARTCIIYADKKSNINALVDKPDDMIPFSFLVGLLNKISKVKGEFKWSESGKDLYRGWYQKFQETDYEDSTGTLERIHDHILKTAMLISLSRKQDLVLELEDVEEAIRACQDFIPGSKRVAIGHVGKSVSAPGTAVLLRALLTAPEFRMSRMEALQRHWQHFDSFELDRISESLQAQGAIEIKGQRIDGKIELMFILSPAVVKKYQEQSEEKK